MFNELESMIKKSSVSLNYLGIEYFETKAIVSRIHQCAGEDVWIKLFASRARKIYLLLHNLDCFFNKINFISAYSIISDSNLITCLISVILISD